eukprot:TRINITY_DN9090_c0_g1_i4.p1 TRINITY_DN9090_c0_g1~~TRINITY_DN9090_c0_g1_i4.p1  ORF type:complete len:448 (-),score=64.55 TRINITY_DN9090_c0_g1_i4:148-1491(-)
MYSFTPPHPDKQGSDVVYQVPNLMRYGNHNVSKRNLYLSCAYFAAAFVILLILLSHSFESQLVALGIIIIGFFFLTLACGYLKEHITTPRDLPLSSRKRKLLGLPQSPLSPLSSFSQSSPKTPTSAKFTSPSFKSRNPPFSSSGYANGFPVRSAFFQPSLVSPTSSPIHHRQPRGAPRRIPKDEVMSDADSLKKYLRSQEEKEHLRTKIDNFSRFGSPPTFQQSHRTTFQVSPLSHATPTSFGSIPSSQVAEELLYKLGVADQIEEFADRMKQWIVKHILKPLVKELDLLEENSLSILKPIPDLPTITSVNPWGSSGQSYIPQNSNNQIVQKRRHTEQYMQVPGCSSREYLVERIRELGKGNVMACFKWKEGGKWNSSPWTSELPTDSQILIHLFCVWMDSQLPPDPLVPPGKSFSEKYFVMVPHSPKNPPQSVFENLSISNSPTPF